MALSIVPTELKYVNAFNAVVDAVARERRYIGFVEAPPLADSESFVRGILAGGGVQVLAIDDEEVVGWCDIVRVPIEGFRHTGRLGMGLLANYRGKGLGRQLAEAAIAAARAAGMKRIELEVFASNVRALHLYERLGFMHEGVKRGARFLDGGYDDNVLMALQP